MAATVFCMSSALLASDVSAAGEFASADYAVRSASNSSSMAALSPAIQHAQQAPVFAPSREVTQPLAGDDEGLQTGTSAKSLAELVEAHKDDMSDLNDEQRCLAIAVYKEARGESLAGQLAVARVIVNRARSDSQRFANNVCGVITQPGQFSFVRGGVIPQVKATAKGLREAVAIARIALADAWASPVEGALYFHARHVSPGWKHQRIAAVDNHVFYR